MAVCIRFLGDDFSPFQIVFFRSCVILSVLLPLLLRTGLSILKTDRPLMILARAISGFAGQVFAVLAIMVAKKLPPGAETEFSIMLGALATMTAAVVNYFFGSSAGSREKTRLIAFPVPEGAARESMETTAKK